MICAPFVPPCRLVTDATFDHAGHAIAGYFAEYYATLLRCLSPRQDGLRYSTIYAATTVSPYLLSIPRQDSHQLTTMSLFRHATTATLISSRRRRRYARVNIVTPCYVYAMPQFTQARFALMPLRHWLPRAMPHMLRQLTPRRWHIAMMPERRYARCRWS